MKTIQSILRDTIRIYKTAQFSTSSVTLYKVPGRPRVRASYTVETLTLEGRTIERDTFRHIRRIEDAEKMYNWLVSLSYQNEAA